MTKFSCVGCGQRYYGVPSNALRCDFCHGYLEEIGWQSVGRRAAMAPLPVLQPPLPANLESTGSHVVMSGYRR